MVLVQMKKINKLNILLMSSLMILGATGCNSSNEDDGIYTDDFVNALKDRYSLKADDGKYVYTTPLEDHGYEYTFTLTCTSDSTFSYIFDATLSKTIKSGNVTGTISSKIKFLWGRFTTSSFNGLAYFEDSVKKVSDDVHLNFYGLVFKDDGTIRNTCYTYTIDGITDDFTSFDVLTTTWDMTMLQVSTLTALSQSLVNCNLW